MPCVDESRKFLQLVNPYVVRFLNICLQSVECSNLANDAIALVEIEKVSAKEVNKKVNHMCFEYHPKCQQIHRYFKAFRQPWPRHLAKRSYDIMTRFYFELLYGFDIHPFQVFSFLKLLFFISI